jgi:hypothetical protein
MINATFSSALK